MLPSQLEQHVIAEKNHWWFVARRDILNDVINEICVRLMDRKA